MIHDILLSLLNPHSKFLPIEEFLITDSVSVFLHPCEKKILKDIIDIIKLHKKILKFIKCYSSNTGSCSSETHQKSLYLQAFANGMEIVLEDYLEEIAELEKRYLQAPSHSLLFIYHKINIYEPLFLFLLKLIRGIKYQKLHGCAIIQYLHQNTLNGNQQIYLAMKTIQSTVNIVFFKHLTHWLLHAKTIDNYGEFFIQYVETQNDLTGDSEKLASSAASGKHTIASNSEGAASTYADIWRYEICYDFLPHFLSTTLAEKILFIGQTVLMFKADKTQRKLQKWNESSDKQTIEVDTLWNNQEYLFFQKIHNLQNSKTLNLTELERVIDEFKSYVTERLSQIAVNQADLVQQLKLIKDYYLLARGEFFLEFIKKTYAFSKMGGADGTIRDIVKAFESAAHNVGVCEELEQFQLVLSKDQIDEEFSDSLQNFDYMQHLELNYKINWPLHLLFSPKVMERYNELFRFLLQVKRMQYDLHMIWCLHREYKTERGELIAIMHLRNQFMFFMDNLQYYIQADVLESQYSILMQTVENSNDFEEIQRAHSIFQANILSLCFLIGNEDLEKSRENLRAENSVLRILRDIFNVCEIFCAFAIKQRIDQKIEENQSLEIQLTTLVQQLINMLFSLKSAPSSTPLSQLLLRLNFNHWFSKQGEKRKEQPEKSNKLK